MTDAKKVDLDATVTLVAVQRGFAMNRLVEPGTEFEYKVHREDGAVRKLPKWAVRKGEAKPAKPEPKGFDTKPADAQAAVRKKAAQLAGDSLA